jgi:hypothetical protein
MVAMNHASTVMAVWLHQCRQGPGPAPSSSGLPELTWCRAMQAQLRAALAALSAGVAKRRLLPNGAGITLPGGASARRLPQGRRARY